ncbi:hypothetical protein EB001_11840 [bacterium]|nr:hypothetical protein [bacterium]
MSNLQSAALSLRDAAKATGMSKSAMLRAIQRGTLSAVRDEHGVWAIQPAELFRVYKPASLSTTDNSTALGQDTAPIAPHADAELSSKLAAAEASLAALNQLLSEVKQSRDDWKQQALVKDQLLLQHHNKPTLLKRLFG